MGSGMDVSGNSNFVVTGNHEPGVPGWLQLGDVAWWHGGRDIYLK